MSHSRTRGIVISSLCAMASTSAAQLTDDFEGYADGDFPSPTWLDAGLIDPDPPNPPDPSAVVTTTTDAGGNPTQALTIIDAVAPSQGIYRNIDPAFEIRIRADVRIDQWSDQPNNPQDDWAIWFDFGVQIPGEDLCCFAENMGLYASTMDRGWRLWWNNPNNDFRDFSIDVPIELGTWYTIDVSYDAVSSNIRTRIVETATGTPLVTRMDAIDSWAPSGDPFDVVAIIDGETSLGPTIGNVATVDNVTILAPCAADIDADGDADADDFFAFLDGFAEGDLGICDVDYYGSCDADDFFMYLDLFAAGCP